jgi:two-component system KDP operon response regulator KdpE
VTAAARSDPTLQAAGALVERPRVLVLDSEPQMHRLLGAALTAAGYELVYAKTGADALREVARLAPDAVVFELDLPDMDGKEVLATARGFYQGPMLVLSARSQQAEKIQALDLGADDYVEKPFSVGELLARLRVALRNGVRRQRVAAVVRVGDLEVDQDRRLVTRGGEPVRLSPGEYDLLKALIAGGGRVVTHAQLLIAAWGPQQADNVAYLRVAIGHLRRKLEEDPANPTLIRTEPYVGYRFGAGR